MKASRVLLLAALGSLVATFAVTSCGSSDSPSAIADAGSDVRSGSRGDSGSPTDDSGPSISDTDPHACGPTARDCTKCGGTSCVAGQCVPTILASAQGKPYSIVVDDVAAYWTNLGDTGEDGSVVSVHLDGTSLKVLAPPPIILSDIAAQGSNVVFSAIHVMRVGKDGSGLTTIGDGPAEGAIAVDSARAYWTGGGTGGKVQAADVNGDGGELTYVLADLQADPAGIAVDATNIYWVNGDGSVWTSAKTANDISTTHVLYQPSPPNVGGTGDNRIAVDDTYVFWSDSELIQRMNKDGTSRTRLATGDARGPVVDNDALYFLPVGDEPTITKISKNGVPIATYDTGGTYASHLAVDDSCIYWTAQPGANPAAPGAGSIERVTK